MQPHHQIITLTATWLATLVALPLLLSVARRSAYALGVVKGQEAQQAHHAIQTQWFEREMTDKQAELDELQLRFDASIEARRKTVADLEERIMSYTGLAVTRTDYDVLVSACETLKLVVRTWRQLKGAEVWVGRAEQQSGELRGPAFQVQSELKELRALPTSKGEAA
jgi:hypothetical protein